MTGILLPEKDSDMVHQGIHVCQHLRDKTRQYDTRKHNETNIRKKSTGRRLPNCRRTKKVPRGTQKKAKGSENHSFGTPLQVLSGGGTEYRGIFFNYLPRRLSINL